MAEYKVCFSNSCAEVNSVKEVDFFNEREIRLSLDGGERLYITGEGLKITSFVKQNGNFTAFGKITQIRVIQKGESIVKRLFK